MGKFNFGTNDTFILFGSGKLLLSLAEKLIKNHYKVIVFTARRNLDEMIDSKPFLSLLKGNNIVYFVSDDINRDANASQNITNKTIGISFGAAWIFKEDFIKKFNGKLLNVHGTRLPQNRGGGGFTWQILRRNRLGYCVLHQVDSGVDTGNVVKYKEFIYPNSCRIPADFMGFYFNESKIFLDEFLNEIRKGVDFNYICQPEYLSIYWPRLNTYKHAFIDWSWDLKDIECFVNAFDEPYIGASTFISGGKRVFLKDCYADYNDGSFHPFQVGLVYRKSARLLFVAAQEGSLIIKNVVTEDGQNITESIKLGERFFTPIKNLEDAKLFRAIYTPSGLKEGVEIGSAQV